ncbi:hypothetical protein ACSTKQ_23715, partial [Vibrio parahaemolyticus]
MQRFSRHFLLFSLSAMACAAACSRLPKPAKTTNRRSGSSDQASVQKASTQPLNTPTKTLMAETAAASGTVTLMAGASNDTVTIN